MRHSGTFNSIAKLGTMHSMKHVLVACAVIALVGCSQQKPSIQFIGVSSGTLTTNIDSLRFRSNFLTNEHRILGVASFSAPMDGSSVSATWFSPDERQMPMGRTSIVLQSGATVARFSLQAKDDWKPSPFEFRIDVYAPGDTNVLVASGSIPFFIGMSDAEIREYTEEYKAWQHADATERSAWETKKAQEDAIVRSVALMLKENNVELATRYDIDGDGSDEFLVATKQDGPPGGELGVVSALNITTFALVDASGSSLLSLQRQKKDRVLQARNDVLYRAFPSGEITLTLLSSGTFSFGWEATSSLCTMDVVREGTSFRALEPTCR